MNFLFLLSDQQRADTLGTVNPAIKTPNLDRLCRSGVRFDRAYPPTPVCLPCRASLVSGRYPSSHRACHNRSHLPESISPTFGSVFHDAGYYTHFIGKSHLASCHDASSPESSPQIHNRAHYRNWHGPHFGFRHADINIGHSTEEHACGMHYGVWLEDRGIDTNQYFGKTPYFGYGTWDLPEEYHNSAWVAETTIKAIMNAVEKNQPFCIWSNFQDPHNPYFLPEPWASMYDPDEMPTTGFKPGEPESFKDKPPFYEELLHCEGNYPDDVHADEGLPMCTNTNRWETKPGERREILAKYYGMVSLMDHHIGKIIDRLEEIGQLDNTCIVFTSDHGDFLGDHGLWYKGVFAFEEGQRVPLIVHAPSIVKGGETSSHFQNLVDIPTTFASLAGLSVPLEWEGIDQSQTWKNPEKMSRPFNIIEERPFSTDFNQRIVHEDNWKLCYYAGRDYGELYNLKADPHQIHNLYDCPEHQSVKQKLVGRILDHEMNKRRPTQNHGKTFLHR